MQSEVTRSPVKGGLVRGSRSDAIDGLDELFDVLSNRRRRAVLHYLKRHADDCPIAISELSRVLAAWEQDVSRAKVTYDDRHSVHTSLHQFHLPKMADSGLVTYNDQETEISLTPLAEDLDIYIETVPERNVPWSDYFLGLSTVLTGLVAAAGLGISPFALLSSMQWAVVTVVAFLVSSFAYAYHQRQNKIGAGEKPRPFTEP